MYTTIDFGNKRVRFETRQYEVGTYIAIYESNGGVPIQSTTNRSERDYHISLRKKCIDKGYKIVEGTFIDYRGRYKINHFEQ